MNPDDYRIHRCWEVNSTVMLRCGKYVAQQNMLLFDESHLRAAYGTLDVIRLSREMCGEHGGERRVAERNTMEEIMAWTAPMIDEVTCGMEVNMYFPAEDEAGDLL